MHATQGHGPAPIDCPMRKAKHPHKQGHGHSGSNHPFASMEAYISHLERSDRSSWQKPDEVVAALGLNGEEVVADMGAGSGYFSVPLAKSVPSGRVYGADPESEMVQFMEKRVGKEGIENLKPLQVDPVAPVLPEAVDLLFICDVLHHVESPVQWLAHLQQFLKPTGALALIEFRMGELPLGPPESMRIPKARLVEMATESGYVLEREIEGILPYQVFLLFKPAESLQNPEGP